MSSEGRDYYFGSIIKNLSDRVSGHEIKFESRRFKPSDILGTGVARRLDDFDGVILVVLFQEGEIFSPQGSATMVAPGVAVAAKHVFADFQKLISEGKVLPLCVGYSDGQITSWQIRNVVQDAGHDIAILSLELISTSPPSQIFTQAHLTCRIPKVGEKVMVAGFKGDQNEFQSTNNHLRFSGRIFNNVGHVKEVYAGRTRDSQMPWPVLEIECDARGGMSGGPAFDVFGNLVGIICSSIASNDELGPCYVSLIYPAILWPIKIEWLGDFLGKSVPIFDMKNHCFFDNREFFQIKTDDNGVIMLTFDPDE